MGHVERPRYLEIWELSLRFDFLKISGPFQTRILVRKYYSKQFSWNGKKLHQDSALCMCNPVCSLACLLVGTVCRNSELLSMHISILRPVSGTYRIPGMLAA